MNTRYSKKMKEDYALQKAITPSFVILQENVGKEVEKYFGTKEISIIDLGSGTGFTTKEILNRNKNARVFCIDIDNEMSKQAKELLKEWIEKKQVELIEADLLTYLKTIKGETVDAVVSALTIHNLKKDYRHELLKEIFRVLKKNGLFVNSDKYNSSNPTLNAKWLAYHSKYQRDKATPLGKSLIALEWNQHNKKDNTKEIVQLEEPSIKEMKEIGFTNIKITYRDHLIATLVAGK